MAHNVKINCCLCCLLNDNHFLQVTKQIHNFKYLCFRTFYSFLQHTFFRYYKLNQQKKEHEYYLCISNWVNSFRRHLRLKLVSEAYFEGFQYSWPALNHLVHRAHVSSRPETYGRHGNEPQDPSTRCSRAPFWLEWLPWTNSASPSMQMKLVECLSV